MIEQEDLDKMREAEERSRRVQRHVDETMSFGIYAQRKGDRDKFYGNLALLLLACIIIAFFLSACSFGPKLKVPEVINETSIYQLGNAYGVVQAAAITYANLPLCPESTVCRTREITAKLAEYDRQFVAAYRGLQGFIRSPDTKDGLTIIELYATASGALNSMAVLARPVAP